MTNGNPEVPPTGGEDEVDDEFGNCCEELKEAMSGEEFEPLIAVGEDGILYLSVGMVDMEDEDEPGMVDHPLYFCPFCGTELQTEETVAALADSDEDGDDDDDADDDSSSNDDGNPPPRMS